MEELASSLLFNYGNILLLTKKKQNLQKICHHLDRLTAQTTLYFTIGHTYLLSNNRIF